MSGSHCKKCFTKSANTVHYTVFVTRGLLLCGGGQEPKEQNEQLNGIAFINQCHIMHLVHSLERSFTVYEQKVYESFGNQLLTCSLVSYTIRDVLDTSPALHIEISCLGLIEVHPHQTML